MFRLSVRHVKCTFETKVSTESKLLKRYRYRNGNRMIRSTRRIDFSTFFPVFFPQNSCFLFHLLAPSPSVQIISSVSPVGNVGLDDASHYRKHIGHLNRIIIRWRSALYLFLWSPLFSRWLSTRRWKILPDYLAWSCMHLIAGCWSSLLLWISACETRSGILNGGGSSSSWQKHELFEAAVSKALATCSLGGVA